MATTSGSGPAVAAVPEAQACWLGQPAQVEAWPAEAEETPGQLEGASGGTSSEGTLSEGGISGVVVFSIAMVRESGGGQRLLF